MKILKSFAAGLLVTFLIVVAAARVYAYNASASCSNYWYMIGPGMVISGSRASSSANNSGLENGTANVYARCGNKTPDSKVQSFSSNSVSLSASQSGSYSQKPTASGSVYGYDPSGHPQADYDSCSIP